MRQAITWTNADPVHRCVYAALGARWVKLTHCGLVTPYGAINLGQYWQEMACCLKAPNHCLNQCWLETAGISGKMRKIYWQKLSFEIELYNFLCIFYVAMLVLCQTITWTNADLLIGATRANFIEIRSQKSFWYNENASERDVLALGAIFFCTKNNNRYSRVT